MLRLHYSNRTEELLVLFGRTLDEERARLGADPFRSTHLVVPNRNVEAWVKVGLARMHGVAAHLEVRFLKRLVAELFEGGPEPVRLLDGAALHGLLLALLLDDRRLDRPDLAPVRSYLRAGGESPAAVDKRRFQLALELSRLFEEYSYSRADLLAAWRAGRLVHAHTPFAEAERFSRRLWLDLVERGGVLDERRRATGVRWLALPDLLDDLRDNRSLLARARLPERLHVFGFSYVAAAFQELFAALAQKTELFIYALNPCEEFWEDVAPRKNLGRADPIEGDDPFGLTHLGDTPALALWGRPGRENIRLLNRLSDCDFVSGFRDPLDDGPSLLHQLQHDILRRRPPTRVAAATNDAKAGDATDDKQATVDEAIADQNAGDPSIRLLACPGVRREVEIVAQEIWRLVRESEEAGKTRAPLRFNEVAVILNPRDQEAYHPHIASVFHACGQIPHTVTDLHLSSDSRIVEAVSRLLALPLSDFTRTEVLGFITHPNVLARYPDLDPEAESEAWITWCDRAGIVRGADHRDHAGTYIEHDLFNFDQGLRRLALGAFMAGERSLVDEPFELRDAGGRTERYSPVEHAQSDQEGAGRLGLLVRSLLADTRRARDASLTPRAWAELLRAMITTYIHATDDDEERDLGACLAALGAFDSLEDLDLRGATRRATDPRQESASDGKSSDGTISYTIAHELVVSALASLPSSHGNYLADGVVVSSFLPMRALPFRAVFILGLGEGRFPSADRHNHLDLRLARRRAGDVSAREQDKYMFLEALLGTRDRLSLSYVARNVLTGEELQPSPVVLELAQMLDDGYLGRGGMERRIERHPLRRFHPDYFPRLFPTPPRTQPSTVFAPSFSTLPEAKREALSLALSQDLARLVGEDARAPSLDALLAALSPTSSRALKDHLGVIDAPSITSLPASQDASNPASYDASHDASHDASRPAAHTIIDAHPASSALPAIAALSASSSLRIVTPPPTRIAISSATLRRFLECPLQGWARHVLRLGGRDDAAEDLLADCDEPFSTGLPETVGLLRGITVEALARGLDPLTLYAERMETLQRNGHAPTGIFSEVERESHVAWLSAWSDEARGLSTERRLPSVVVRRFGGAEESAVVQALEDPIRFVIKLDRDLDGGSAARAPDHRSIEGAVDRGKTPPVLVSHDVEIELSGKTEALVDGGRGSLLFSARSHRTDAEGLVKSEKEAFRAFIDHALVAAARPTPDSDGSRGSTTTDRGSDGNSDVSRGDHAAYLCFLDAGPIAHCRYSPLTRDEARAWLGGVVRAMLTGSHAYLLPIEAVFDHRLAGRATVGESVERVRRYKHYSSLLGPIASPGSYAAPSESDARAMIEERFGAYFACRSSEAAPIEKSSTSDGDLDATALGEERS